MTGPEEYDLPFPDLPEAEQPPESVSPDWLMAPEASPAKEEFPNWLQMELTPQLEEGPALPSVEESLEVPPLPAVADAMEAPTEILSSVDLPLPDFLAEAHSPVETVAELPVVEAEIPVMAEVAALEEIPAVPAVTAERILPKVDPKTLPIIYGVVAKVSATRPTYHFRVHHQLPADVTLLETQPKAKVLDEQLVWDLGNLEIGEEVRIRVKVQPLPGAKFSPTSLTNFHATYSQFMQLQTPVVRPKLSLQTSAPKQVLSGEPVSVLLEVTNNGNWDLDSVQLHTVLPTYLKHPNGSEFTIDLGSLQPAEVRKVTLGCQAIAPGSGEIQATVHGGEDISAESTCEIQVTQAELALALESLYHTKIREEIVVQVHVSNPGTAALGWTAVQMTLPQEIEFLSSEGAKYEVGSRRLRWSIPTIMEGESINFTVRCRPMLPGEAIFQASATSGSWRRDVQSVLTIEFDQDKSLRLIDQFLAAMQEQHKVDAQQTKKAVLKSKEKAEQHIVFTLAGTDFAVPITRVLEVGKPGSYCQVPNVPDWLMGVTNVRGDILSMVNLRQFLGQESMGLNDARMLVVRSGNHEMTTALIVDRVRGIRNVVESRIIQPSTQLEDRLAAYMRGIAEEQGRFMVVLDVDRLLLSAEMRQRFLEV